MMHLSTIAAARPRRAAVVAGGTGEAVGFADLDAAALRIARLLHDRGLRPGDRIAVLMENGPAWFRVCWAAQRSGLLYVPVNWHLTAAEAAFVVADSGAQVLVASAALAGAAAEIAAAVPGVRLRFQVGGEPGPGVEDLDAAAVGHPATPREGEIEGSYMFYSSGTTGRPKGIEPDVPLAPFGTGLHIEQLLGPLFGFGPDSVYLCPGPLYHAAPLGWSLGAQRLGGTVVVMERFDAEQVLALVERYRVTHAQFVPTMFVRMLRLPREVRVRRDLSSLQQVVHAAAPCPVDVKRAMIDWLGPIVHEYYGGSEGNAFLHIDAPTWLAHPGSVGRPAQGAVHVLDDDGAELPPGEVGMLWFEGTRRFRYHGDPERTAAAYNDRGWSTLGDLGHVDADGFVHVADRRTDLIVSGGVNIYPREVEDVLAQHPDVADVAVVAVPDPDLGHAVRAVVQSAPGVTPGPELAERLIAYSRARLAGHKCPRAVDFDPELPRLPTGKLLRRRVRDRYWPTG
jgi:acyl-CoA synthetase (AMP-forming)/AMP-acid ligase II